MHFSPRHTASTLLLSVIFLSLFVPGFVSAQTNVEKYGQNRMQHREFKWKFFDTKHFRIYHYDRSGIGLAKYVAEQVEGDIAIIENKLGGQFPGRFNIILYNNYEEYQQSNIGRKYDSQLQDIPAGTVDIVGDKLVVYYTGIHTDLRRQTRSGMARVVMERMLFGETLKEVVRNAILMNLPQWTVNGFISYLVDGWDPESNSEWKNLMAADTSAGFYKLAEKNPELAGKAFWKYVSDRYGESNMKSVVYTTQIKSSLNQGVKMTLGMKVKDAYDSAVVFYKDVYAREDAQHQKPDTSLALLEIPVPKDGSILRDIRVSPNGRDVAYVTWKNGEFKVHIQRTGGTQVSSVVMEGGKLDYGAAPDPDYPIITWSNTGYKLAIMYRKYNVMYLRVYNSLKAKIEYHDIPANRFDRVLSMTFMEDDDKLIFSAIKKGKTDLYEFTIRGKRMKNITDDAWDDLQPWYVSGGSRRGVLFLSNRSKPNIDAPLAINELPTGPMNVYFYNTTTKRKELLQLTKVTTGDISQPIQYGPNNYSYLYNINGVDNQYIIVMTKDSRNNDSAYSVAVTDYSSNVVSHQYNPMSNQVSDVIQDGNKYKVYYKKLLTDDAIQSVDPKTTILKQSESEKKRSVITNAAIIGKEKPRRESVLKKGNAFETQFEDEEEEAASATANEEKPEAVIKRGNAFENPGEAGKIAQAPKKTTKPVNDEEVDITDSTYYKLKAQNYKLNFKPDFLSVRLDNSVLFTRYQPVTGGNGFVNPSLGGMVTVSLDDIMEDYRFTGGFRLPVNFNGMTYFFQFENAKRRVDWNVLYLRQTSFSNYLVNYVDTSAGMVYENEQLGKTTMDMIQGGITYPLNKFESIRLNLGLRRDAVDFKSQDFLSLTYPAPDRQKYWVMSRAEYVFDNTINPTINIYRGFRFKFFADYMYRLNGGGGGFYNLGTDFRFYQKIYKNCTWAVRFAGAHSAGKQKILYFLGGVDNWIPAKSADDVPIRPGEQYAFQALATNMRGYEQNSWNGNTYAVINTEFRLPILTTILQRPIQSSILRNLQLVPFADLGSAWYGLAPTENNVSNNRYFPRAGNLGQLVNNPIVVTVDDPKGVFGLGYGVGLRTMVFGYFARLDCAWNRDHHKRQPMLHFSIGTDF